MIDSPELIFDYVVSPIFFRGAITTMLVTLLSMALGMVVGLVLALMQQARIPPSQILVTAYLWLFRGTPVLFQIIFVFYVLPAKNAMNFNRTINNHLADFILTHLCALVPSRLCV